MKLDQAWILSWILVFLALVQQNKCEQKVYTITNAWNCDSYKSSHNYVCGFAVYRDPDSLFMYIPTKVSVNERTSSVELRKTRWIIQPVEGADKNVVKISDADCNGQCGYWYTDQFGIYILHMEVDHGDTWRFEKTGDGDYYIRAERNCDKPRKPWPCGAYLTWFPYSTKYHLYLDYNNIGYNRWKAEKEQKQWPG